MPEALIRFRRVQSRSESSSARARPVRESTEPVSRQVPKKEETDDQPTFTEITLDVHDDRNTGFSTRF